MERNEIRMVRIEWMESAVPLEWRECSAAKEWRECSAARVGELHGHALGREIAVPLEWRQCNAIRMLIGQILLF